MGWIMSEWLVIALLLVVIIYMAHAQSDRLVASNQALDQATKDLQDYRRERDGDLATIERALRQLEDDRTLIEELRDEIARYQNIVQAQAEILDRLGWHALS